MAERKIEMERRKIGGYTNTTIFRRIQCCVLIFRARARRWWCWCTRVFFLGWYIKLV